MIKKLHGRISKRETIAEDTTEITVDLPEKLDFTAGQYVTLTLPSLKEKPIKEQFRDFSIASPPSKTKQLAIAFRNSDSLFKKTLLATDNKTDLTIEGPKGVFVLKENPGHTVFIAGGIGITPFVSIIQENYHQKSKYPITLYYFNSSQKRAAYLQELEAISSKNKNLKVIPIFDSLTEKILLPFIEKHQAEISCWYIAGPPGMTVRARKILTNAGVRDQYIKTEEFTGYS